MCSFLHTHMHRHFGFSDSVCFKSKFRAPSGAKIVWPRLAVPSWRCFRAQARSLSAARWPARAYLKHAGAGGGVGLGVGLGAHGFVLCNPALRLGSHIFS